MENAVINKIIDFSNTIIYIFEKKGNMNVEKTRKKISAALDLYERMLDQYSLDVLTKKPTDGSWSIGQVYTHTWMASKGFFLKNVEHCLKEEGTFKGERKNFNGFVLFLMGKIPDKKYKMPNEVAVQPYQPESKEQLYKRIQEVRDASEIALEQYKKSSPEVKYRHPFLGYLNAGEWLQLCGMHYMHHVQQIKRIEKSIGFKG